MRSRALTSFVFILLVQQAMSQVMIRGRVYDMVENVNLPYVTVVNENTQDTVYTDIEGLFSISAEPGHVIHFLYVGFVDRYIKTLSPNFIEVGIKQWSSDHDFGWNRVYLGPTHDFTNQVLGGEISYLSNPLIGYDFLLNPHLSFLLNQEIEIKNAVLKIYSFIPRNDRLEASLSFKYQAVNFLSYDFENFIFSVLPRIKGIHFNIGLSTSKYSIESNNSDFLGFLIGFQEDIKVAGRYFPIEYNSIFWKNNIEFNLRITHQIKRWLRMGIHYQHYREFNQLGFNLSYSFRLDPKIKNEY